MKSRLHLDRSWSGRDITVIGRFRRRGREISRLAYIRCLRSREPRTVRQGRCSVRQILPYTRRGTRRSGRAWCSSGPRLARGSAAAPRARVPVMHSSQRHTYAASSSCVRPSAGSRHCFVGVGGVLHLGDEHVGRGIGVLRREPRTAVPMTPCARATLTRRVLEDTAQLGDHEARLLRQFETSVG